LPEQLPMRPVLLLVCAYLLGSIPFGYLIVRGKEGADVRRAGSGGTGATNVTRRAGKAAGLLTLLLDALKGWLAVWLAWAVLGGEAGINMWVAAAALLALVGHCFPVWLGFRGGKGVATGLGIFLWLAPLAVACACALFVAVVWATRYVSLGSMTAVAALPLCIWLLGAYFRPVANLPLMIATAVAAGALVIFMHRANISRLLGGTESKFK
jgi:acyl phosphate:glycerol-3-phosphate acyltransferase